MEMDFPGIEKLVVFQVFLVCEEKLWVELNSQQQTQFPAFQYQMHGTLHIHYLPNPRPAYWNSLSLIPLPFLKFVLLVSDLGILNLDLTFLKLITYSYLICCMYYQLIFMMPASHARYLVPKVPLFFLGLTALTQILKSCSKRPIHTSVKAFSAKLYIQRVTFRFHKWQIETLKNIMV